MASDLRRWKVYFDGKRLINEQVDKGFLSKERGDEMLKSLREAIQRIEGVSDES